MDIGSIPLFAAMAKRMSWLTARQTVLAENVANANTPGYVAKDLKELDFSGLVQKPGQIQLAATEPGHIVQRLPDNGGTDIVVEADDQSLDGNGVSAETQMMKVSTNAADFSLVTTLYKDNVALIKSVLGGS